ncbi:MAG: mannose-1-phosphate guanylyltransferase [Flavobacteriales bacterium]|jgi:mannose-1-phosphate guanylyltransferase
MINPNHYCVIMAGGIGSRFWPMSKSDFPKQFHDVLGTGKTLIQQTFDRFEKICLAENIFVVTHEDYKQLVKEQIPAITDAQILCEPSRRNTAPCVAYAAYKIHEINPAAQMIVAPSDHLILKEEAFVATVVEGLSKAHDNCLVTLGIKPSRPDTGYGYIQFVDEENDGRVRRVKTFTEKPDKELAKQFIESGDFYWNSGIFIWNTKTIIAQFEAHLPDMARLFEEGRGIYNTKREVNFIKSTYETCTNVSIDFGIMEKATSVFVVLSDFGWSDLGTWGSLYTHLNHDKNNNGVTGKKVRLYESEGNIVHVPKNKLVVLQGLKDYIVVDANDVLLVCKKDDEQKIKQFVIDIKHEFGDNVA